MPRTERESGSSLVREYTTLAANYDTRWACYIDASVRETLARLPLRSGDRILDAGCGTGELLCRLTMENETLSLAGIDPVAGMLERARQRLPESVVLEKAWADDLPFADAGFDTVVSSSMFHYLSEPQTVLAEFRRVLVPGGTLVLTDWCRDFFSTRVIDCYLRLFNKAHRKTWGLHELSRLLESNGFAVTRADKYRISRWWGLMTVNACSGKPLDSARQIPGNAVRVMD